MERKKRPAVPASGSAAYPPPLSAARRERDEFIADSNIKGWLGVKSDWMDAKGMNARSLDTDEDGLARPGP